MWPISPAVLSEPRSRPPLATIPPPIPVPTATIASEETPRPSPHVHSERASALTSLSANTASPVRSPTRRARGTPASSDIQLPSVGRIVPFSTSTRPGRPSPMPRTGRARAAASASSRSTRVRMVAAALPGVLPACTVDSTAPSAVTRPAEIVDAPTSTPMAKSDMDRSPHGRRQAMCQRQVSADASALRGRPQGHRAGPEAVRGKAASRLVAGPQARMAAHAQARHAGAGARREWTGAGCHVGLRAHRSGCTESLRRQASGNQVARAARGAGPARSPCARRRATCATPARSRSRHGACPGGRGRTTRPPKKERAMTWTTATTEIPRATRSAASIHHAAAGDPVVCIHASASSGAQWTSLVERLEDRFRPLAVDLHGAGRTPAWRGDRRLTLADEVALLEPTLAATGARLHLVGHSYGAAVALRIALDHPHWVASLTVFEPVLFSLL